MTRTHHGTATTMITENTYHVIRDTPPPAPPGCPINSSWSPLNEDYLAEPYAIAAQLRDQDPVFYAEQLGYLVVNRMEDIERIFTDHETFASVNVQDPVFAPCPQAQEVLAAPDFNPVAVMSNRSEPEHGRIRVYTRQGFSNKRIRTLEPYIRRRSHELVDAMLAEGSPAEFIKAFAFPLPGETVFRFIGFPEGDDEMLKNWCGDRKAFAWGKPTEDEQTVIAEHMLAYWRYCRDFTADRRQNRGDDLASELIDAHEANPQDLSYNEVESIIYGLSFAGHEAITALICNTLQCLLPRRDQWDQVCSDASLINNAIEEVLRFNSSQISWRRLTTVDTTIGDLRVPAGTPIFLNFAAANREPGVWEQPDTFDIHRGDASRHISFGKGIHHCLGAKFARFETRIMLEIVSQRLPTLRLVERQAFSYFPNITFRGPDALHVQWN